MKKTWIITYFNGQDEQMCAFRVFGDEEQVKKVLLNLVEGDRFCDPEKYEFGCESSDSITENEDGYLYAYASYGSYTINYYAIPDSEAIDLDKEEKHF